MIIEKNKKISSRCHMVAWFFVCLTLGCFLFGKNVLAANDYTKANAGTPIAGGLNLSISNYDKPVNGTLSASEWNGLIYDFVNTWSTSTMAGPLGIGTAASASYRLDVNGSIRATNFSGAYTGTLNSANVSAGAFAANTGGGNFSFPGYVGIGTTNPIFKLELVDSVNPLLSIYNSVTNQVEGGRIRFTESRNTIQGGYLHYDASANVFSLGVHNVVDLLPANDIDALNIGRGTGNIGIGTLNPLRKLDVFGASSMSALTFTGTGVDDATLGGTFTGNAAQALVIKIDGTGTPDTFTWSVDGGLTWVAANIAITGAAQTLADIGTTVLFTSTTGHTMDDSWQATLSSPTGVVNSSGGYAIGNVMFANNFGYRNTAIGLLSMSGGDNTGGYNTATGYYSLQLNTTGDYNTVSGYSAGRYNTSGSANTTAGYYTLNANTTGSYNNANGMSALSLNTTGSYNVANGPSALGANTTGNSNTATGYYALSNNTIGSSNTADGQFAGRFIANGSSVNSTSSNSVYIGYNSRALLNGGDNEIVIGQNAIGNGSNTVTLGNSSIVSTLLKGNVGIGTTAPLSLLNVQGTNLPGLLTLSNSQTTVLAGDTMGQIDFYTKDVSGITNRVGASIKSMADFDYTGSQAPTSLAFLTQGTGGVLATEKMRLTNAGFLGIGTSTPGSKLTIVGGDLELDNNKSIKVGSSNSDTTLLVGNYADGQGFAYGTTSPNHAASLAVEGDVKGNRLCIQEDCKAAWSDIVIAGGGNQWSTSGNNIFNANTGGVGIGTSTPGAYKLFVNGNTNINGILTATSFSGTYAGTIGSPNVSSGAFASNTGGGNFSFPGSVGIGTTNPISTLNLHNVGSDTAGSGALSFTVSNDTGPGWNMRVGAAGSDGDFFIDRRLASLWYNVLTMDRTTGNTSINGTLTATSFSGAYNGTIGSPNVSAGAFASNTGGGNFSFPGSLGIGTTAPTAPLHIFGAGKLATFGDTVNNTKYIIIRDSVANGLMFGLLSTAFGGGDGTAVIRAGGNKAFAVKANDTTDFPSISSYDFLINTSGNAIFSGNVGMGTTTLGAYRLNVNGDTNINGALSATSFSGAYAGTINSANVSAGAFASNTGGGNFSFPGNVGIGTTNPLVKLDVSSGTYGLPATSSTIQTAGALRLEAGAFGNVVLDMGVNGASGTWLQTTNKTDLSQEYPLLLNPNGGNVGIGTTNPSRPLTVIGNAQFGDTNSTGTLTPLNVSFGGTYGTNIPGTVGNLKWDMFTNGSSGNRYGIGMSTNLMEFQAGSSGQLGFFVNQGTEAMRILANGSVGIGTSTPGAYKLYVNGDTNINGAVTATSFSGPYVGTINSGNVSAGTFASNTGGGNFSFPGNLGIGTAVPNSQLSVGTVSGSGVKTILEGQVSSYPTYASRIQVSGSYNQAMILDLDYNNLSAYDSFQINMHGNQTQFFISNSGNVGIGTTNPAAKLDIYSGGTGLIIGGDSAATTRTDATLKYGRIGAAHYLNAQAPMGILLTQSDSTRNILNFGGGTGTFNAATEINFYTAANNTTLTGTNRMTINSSGNVGIGTANPSFKLDVSGSIGSSANSITGYIDTGRNVTPWDQTFEENIIGWSQINSTSITQSSAQEYEGSNSLMIKRNDTGGSGGAMFTLGTQLIPGRTYTLSGYYKMVNGAGTASIKLNSNGTTAYTNGTAYTDKTLANAANWTFFSVSITAATITVGNNYVWIGSAMPDAVQELYFDNLVFSEGSLPSNTYANMKTNLSGASTYFGGNVGVGTANPGAYRLNVNGDTNITGTLNVTGTITGGAAMTGTLNAGNVSSGAFASNTGGGNFSFPGNIGIGTTLPTYALDNASTTRSLSYALVGGGGSISATGLFTTAGVTNGSGIIQNTGVIVSPSNDFSDARIWRPVSGNGVFNAFAFTGSIMQTGTANGTTRGLYIAPTLTAALDFRAIEMTNSTGFGLYQSGAANNYFNGSIGIGTSTPTEAKLVINAGVGMALKAYGNVVVTGTLQTQTGSDFAEEFTTTKDLETGTVVVMDDNGYKSVRPCDTSYDKTVVGIVSNNPSIIAGRVNSKYKAVIAMMGVVKVKVIDINGKVSKGDMLTTSGVSGYAMKADSLKPGTMIGKAMENLDGKTGEINVLVNLQ